jgi:hypothetical protein
MRIFMPIIIVVIILVVVLSPTDFLAWLTGGNLRVNTAPAIITQIRNRSTLVTTEFTSQVHVEVTNEALLPFLPSEQLWLQAEGTILAGIDLDRIAEEDVTINGREVIIQVPPAYIVSQEMQNVQILTDQGVMPGINPNMQQMAEDDARAELLRSACEYGILEQAEQEAQVALSNLLTPMGFETIRLVQQDTLPGVPNSCSSFGGT